MAFHNTYNKELVVEEYKKRFQQILEYTSAGGFDLSEADDEQAADEQPKVSKRWRKSLPWRIW